MKGDTEGLVLARIQKGSLQDGKMAPHPNYISIRLLANLDQPININQPFPHSGLRSRQTRFKPLGLWSILSPEVIPAFYRSPTRWLFADLKVAGGDLFGHFVAAMFADSARPSPSTGTMRSSRPQAAACCGSCVAVIGHWAHPDHRRDCAIFGSQNRSMKRLHGQDMTGYYSI